MYGAVNALEIFGGPGERHQQYDPQGVLDQN